MKLLRSITLMFLCCNEAQGFTSPIRRYQTWSQPVSSLGMSDAAGGGIERLEFKIHPDGRIEETVKGVRGNNCHKITEDINAALGEVVSSRPTEEMYEQELRVSNTVEVKDENNGGWSSTDSSW